LTATRRLRGAHGQSGPPRGTPPSKPGAATSEAGLVVSRVDGPGPTEIDSRLRTAPTDGNQPEGLGWFRRCPTLERFDQRPGDKGADADAPAGRLPPDLRSKPILEPYRGAQLMQSVTVVSRCINGGAQAGTRAVDALANDGSDRAGRAGRG